jgi:hypothetical protein
VIAPHAPVRALGLLTSAQYASQGRVTDVTVDRTLGLLPSSPAYRPDMDDEKRKQLEEWATSRSNRLPSFTEVLSRRTRPPVDLFMF